ncbi:MAG: fused MFS/spermidine synthase, partial [Anaerolineae bacterium]|nr:fused MFS/spermidine synthase [Anaerolineae bacterium]
VAALLNAIADSVNGLPLLLRMVLFVVGIFLLPSILIGLIPPLVVKLTLSDLTRTGNVVGRIYAMSSLGSILGTFLTGYVLLANFGVRSIVLGVAAVLLAIGYLLLASHRSELAQIANSQ